MRKKGSGDVYEGKIYRTWCERQGEAGLNTLQLRFTYIQACLSNRREGPGGVHSHGDLDISWKGFCAPLGDGRGVFIHSQSFGLNLRWVERGAEGRSK